MPGADDDHESKDDADRPSSSQQGSSGGKDGDSGKDKADEKDGDKKDGDDKEGDDKDGGDKDEKKPSPLKNPKVRIALIIAAIVAVIVLIVWFIHYRTYSRFQQSTNDAYLAADQVNVAPRVSGYVEQVLVGDNQMVRAGQMLVRIEAQDYNATADQSRAQIAQAQATTDQARAQRRQQFDTIRQNLAQANQSRDMIRQYDASVRFNEAQVLRYAPLSAAGAETNEKLAQYLSDLKQARAQADGAR
ncbi:HlyD family secretion protein, partial [Sphingomonas bacterium]|uniref:HlyD family secretion protein n=1 Tax=Sphingomonas bacterium TaxID=1895847 RepID=UPI001576CD4A